MNARLLVERDAIEALLERPCRALLERVTPDLQRYDVLFEVRTLVRGDDRVIREEERIVRVAYLLTAEHPLLPPLVIAGDGDLFCTHVHDPHTPGTSLPPIPLMCLGGFSVDQRIANWVFATYSVLGWKRIASDHAVNHEAAAWARREMASGRFPIERRSFFIHEPAPDPGGRLRVRLRSEAPR